jgi:hypothetical protein
MAPMAVSGGGAKGMPTKPVDSVLIYSGHSDARIRVWSVPLQAVCY